MSCSVKASRSMSDRDPTDLAQWPDVSVLGVTAFHVQQATEKVLKALLVAAVADFRQIHDLNELASLAHRQGPDVVPAAFPLARATTWYLVSRHPGIDDISLEVDEIASALGEAEALAAKVMQLVPAALRAP